MLQNLTIRTKLIAILAGPLLALTILGSVGIGTNLADSVRSDRVRELAEFNAEVNALVRALQDERSLASRYVGTDRQDGGDELDRQQQAVDEAVVRVREQSGAQDGGTPPELPELTRAQLDTALGRLELLPEQREAIREGDGTDEERVPWGFAQYDATIDALLGVGATVANGSRSEDLLRAAETAAFMSQLASAIDKERALLARIPGSGDPAAGEYEALVATTARQANLVNDFQLLAVTEQRDALNDVLDTEPFQEARRLHEVLEGGDQEAVLSQDPETRWTAATSRLEQIRSLETSLAGSLTDLSLAFTEESNSRTLAFSTMLTIVLWGAVGISLIAARSMVAPLVHLRDVASEVAQRRLPGIVDRLQQGEEIDLDQERLSVDLHAEDEIGQVAEAFDLVHGEAIRIAGEQAGLRRSVGDMFLNFAHRNQSLIHRQLERIDRLEKQETDPELLENLYYIDHLATRMRRNAENLIVLSGSDPSRRWRGHVLLNDVIRASVAEIEDYTRIDTVPVNDVAVVGRIAGDVMHLLAELLENATVFSPPNTQVRIQGQSVSKGYVLEIEDRGIGIDEQTLAAINHRLADPPAIDFSVSRTLGFFVVGRLAHQHGIKVQLRQSWYGGITAMVLIPSEFLVDPEGAGSLEQFQGNRPALTGRRETVEASGQTLPAVEQSSPWVTNGTVTNSGPVAAQDTEVWSSPTPVQPHKADLDAPIFTATQSEWVQRNGPEGTNGQSTTQSLGVLKLPAESRAASLPQRQPRQQELQDWDALIRSPRSEALDTGRPGPEPPSGVRTGPQHVRATAAPAGAKDTTWSPLPRRVPMASLPPQMTAALDGSTPTPTGTGLRPAGSHTETESPYDDKLSPQTSPRLPFLSYRQAFAKGRLDADVTSQDGIVPHTGPVSSFVEEQP